MYISMLRHGKFSCVALSSVQVCCSHTYEAPTFIPSGLGRKLRHGQHFSTADKIPSGLCILLSFLNIWLHKHKSEYKLQFSVGTIFDALLLSRDDWRLLTHIVRTVMSMHTTTSVTLILVFHYFSTTLKYVSGFWLSCLEQSTTVTQG